MFRYANKNLRTTEPVNLKSSYPMRDPLGSMSRHERDFFVSFSRINGKNQVTLTGEYLQWDEDRQNVLNPALRQLF